MRSYTDEQIENYENDRSEWMERGQELTDMVLSYSFRNSRAEQFSREGFVRRLNNLDHAMGRLAEIYPPNTFKASRNTVHDAELLLQSFVMNVFGAIDNLAWVWTLERGVTRPCGKALMRSEVVFDGNRAKTLIASLTPALAEVINEASDWFKALRVYRDGVAHQIPIYIPRLLNKDEAERAACLKVAIEEAIANRNHRLMNELHEEHYHLGDYGAIMALSGKQRTLIFHAQMVCDLATVVNLGEALFSELNSEQKTPQLAHSAT